MRQGLTICIVGLMAAVGVTVASAAEAPAWTTSKAERIVKRDVTIHMPAPAKASLLSELRGRVMLFRGLEIEAGDVGHHDEFFTYHNWANRYQRALETVEGGLQIEAANCAGSRRGVGRERFKQFACIVTSEILRIPMVELNSSGGDGPLVVEGAPREVGPLLSQLRVQVTGKTTFAYR